MFQPALESIMTGIEVRSKLAIAQLKHKLQLHGASTKGRNVSILKGDVNFITFFKYDEYFHHFRCNFDTSYKAFMWHT